MHRLEVLVRNHHPSPTRATSEHPDVSCIPLRFIEMQAFLAELVEAFQFELPKDEMKIQRGVVGTGMVPMIRGKPELGAILPLRISLAH